MKFSYAVIGGGSWGMAIANTLAKDSKKRVVIWAKEKEVVNEINHDRKNSLYFPNLNIEKTIYGTNNLDEAVAPIIFYTTPAQHFRKIIYKQKKFIRKNMIIIICSKGIEEQTGNFLSDVLEKTNMEINYGVLSGPSFAFEVGKGKPVALVLAAKTLELAENISKKLIFKRIRLYLSDDLIGVQVGGSIKNVYAIGCGIVKGIDYGQSAISALLTRSILEMCKFCEYSGGKRETILGLSGLGDAILTCNSELSRNFILGKFIGEGKNIKQIINEKNTVSEGYYTVKAIHKIARQNSLEMPVLNAIYSILYENINPRAVADKFMSRPTKIEGFY